MERMAKKRTLQLKEMHKYWNPLQWTVTLNENATHTHNQYFIAMIRCISCTNGKNAFACRFYVFVAMAQSRCNRRYTQEKQGKANCSN